MDLKDEFRKIVTGLTEKFTIPSIEDIFFPSFHRGGQPKDCEFMAIRLKGGAAGISYVLVPDEKGEAYTALKPADFVGKDPSECAQQFGSGDPVKAMIGLAAINAVCQHVMREIDFTVDSATDSLGLLSVSAGDRVGMVGLFSPLVQTIKKTGAKLVVIEKNERLIERFPHLPVTLDVTELSRCNKILCTGATLLNSTLDDILAHCSPGAFISIIGPTAGYFPDPLFARGVDVVGGRVVKDGALLLQLLAEKKRWGDATQKICFQKKTYTGIF
jgi:uncharacterized protein